MAKCGKCDFKGSFDEYLNHKCSDGFKPTQPEHHGEIGKKISEAALKRGAERVEAEKK